MILSSSLYSQSAINIQSIEFKVDSSIEKESAVKFEKLKNNLDSRKVIYSVVNSLKNTVCVNLNKTYIYIRVISNNKINNLTYSLEYIKISDSSDKINTDNLYDSYSDLTLKYFRKGVKRINDFNKYLPERLGVYEFQKVKYLEIKDLSEVFQLIEEI